MRSSYMCDGILNSCDIVWNDITNHRFLFLQSHTKSIQNTVFGYKRILKIEAFVIFIEELFISLLTIWFDNQIGVLIVKKNLPIKYHAAIYTIFMCKIVRKSGQNRDFAKLHSTPKNQLLNIWKNRFWRVERTLWTSSGCNMGTWRPITTKPPTLLRISWFWVFFRWVFNVNGYVGNKRSTSVDQNYYHQKGLVVSYKKHFYHFLIRHILFLISSFLCWRYATSPLENLTFK